MSQTKPTDVECTKFAESYVINRKVSEAYLNAFPKSKANAKTLMEMGTRFRALGKVDKRIKQLEKFINDVSNNEAIYTVQNAMNELSSAIEFSKQCLQPSPVVTAIMGKAKIAGLLVDRVQDSGRENMAQAMNRLADRLPN